MDFARNIKQIREFKNLSQEYIAQELDISQSTYAKIENGQLIPKIDRLQRIAQILEVDLSALLSSTNNFNFNFNSNATQSGYINTQNITSIDVELIRKIVREKLDNERKKYSR